MFIESISMENFRDFENKSLKFDEINTILGDNGVGKSSIAEGIVFGLYGVSIFGSPRCDSLIKNGATKAVVDVIIRLQDGKTRVVRRTKTTEKSEVFLDGQKTTQKTINEKVLERVDSSTFLLGFNPLFYETLEPSKLRQTVTSLCMPPTRQEVMSALTLEGRRLLEEADDLEISDAKEELKNLQDNKLVLQGQIEILKKQLESASGAKEKLDTEELERKITALKVRKKLLEEKARKPQPTPPSLVDIAVLEMVVQQLRNSYKEATLIPRVEPGNTCPTCGQKVSQQAAHQVTNNRRAQLQELAATGQTKNAELEKARRKNLQAETAHKKAVASWREEYNKIQKEIKQVDAEMQALQKKITEAAVVNSKFADKEKLREQQVSLEADLAQCESDIAYYNTLVGTLGYYNLTLSQMSTEKLSNYLHRVSIKLFDVVKSTGEMLPTFKLLYDKKPVAFLSFSEKIRVGLELGQMIRTLSGAKIPLFLDNSESITKLDFDVTNTQTFFASVFCGAELSLNSSTAEVSILPPMSEVSEYKIIPSEKVAS